MNGSGLPVSMRSTARSESGSRPTSLASNSRPSASVTWMRPPRRMTCSLVRMVPSARTMTPEPRLVRVERRGRGVEEVAEELLEERIGERRRPLHDRLLGRDVHHRGAGALDRLDDRLRRSGSVSGAAARAAPATRQEDQDRRARLRHRGRVSSDRRSGRSRSGGARTETPGDRHVAPGSPTRNTRRVRRPRRRWWRSSCS